MLTLQSLATAAAVGIASGTDAAIWGMYKDASHEGFSRARFARSIVVGAAVAVLIQLGLHLALPSAGALVTLFGLAYAAERGIVEVWKTFVRNEDQSKYFIPMQFTLLGAPVANRAVRLAAGALYVSIVAVALLAISALDGDGSRPLRHPLVALLGLGAGAIVAAGGAWKDAPKEGFSPLKFWRSPCMAALFAMLLSYLTDSYLEATVAALGFERATAEMYKTFFFPSRPRGKFAGKPVLYPDMLTRRRRLVPVYVVIKAALIVSIALALGDVLPSSTEQASDTRHVRGVR